MKIILAATLSLLAIISLQAQSQTASQSPPQDTPYTIVDKTLNSRTWESTTYETTPSGEVIAQPHRYVEVGANLYYPDPQTGELTESQPQVDLMPDGSAQAVHGQSSIFFPSDLYSGVLQVVGLDGVPQKSRPVGVSYWDGTNSVLIGELTNTVGQLISNDSNSQVIYTNAFSGINADMVVTVRRYGLECDLVMRSQPPAPESFGLNPANCRLELVTEYFDTADPQPIAPPSASSDTPEAADPLLNFGSRMVMTHGRAFVLSSSANSEPSTQIPVSKTWGHTTDGRTLLIESVSLPLISSDLQTLPPSETIGTAANSAPASKTVATTGSILNKVSTTRLLPSRRIASANKSTRVASLGAKAIQRAKSGPKAPGFDLDFVELISDPGSFVFRGDTTYLIENVITYEGFLTFEGGAVLKFNTDPTSGFQNCVVIYGGAQFNSAPYRPVIFTSQNDSSCGESLSVGGTPLQYWQALAFAPGFNIDFHDLSIKDCIWGIQGPNVNAADCQFFQCNNPFRPEWGSLFATNILVVDADTVFNGETSTDTIYHLTVDGCTNLIGSPFNPDYTNNVVIMTNCLLAGVISNGMGTLVTNQTVWTAPTEQVFQVVGSRRVLPCANDQFMRANET